MDFYNYYLTLCNKIGMKPSPAGEAAGFSKTAVNGWKRGHLPTDINLQKLSAFFGVSIESFYECNDIKARNIKQGIKAKLDIINEIHNVEEEDKKTPSQPVTVDSATKNRHDYVNSLFDQLTFENQIDSINFLKMKLQSQSVPDNQKESD